MIRLLITLVVLCIYYITYAQIPTVVYTSDYSGFTSPVDITNAGDGSDRLFIVERLGVIKVIENGSVLPTPFLDINDIVSNGNDERGLLGLAFHPDYSNNGYLFVNYIGNDGHTRIARYTVSVGNPNIADENSARIILQVDQFAGNHNGGDLNFSPIDGYLYIGMGDGGGANDPQCKSQDGMSMLGKMLRIDIDNMDPGKNYSVPSDNPFVGNASVLDEIWALGLRNPWRVSFDRLTGDLWIADVGQGAQEEVNFQPYTSTGGENYGWSVYEGTDCFVNNCSDATDCIAGNYTAPIFEFGHPPADPEGGYSITGGFVYRGCKYAGLYGKYIVTDYITANSYAIEPDGTSVQLADSPSRISTYGEDEYGEMYAAKLTGSGNIYSISESSYPDEIILTTANNPISGTYIANSKIEVQSDVVVANGQTVNFISPEVLLSDDITIPANSILEISKVCED